MRMKSTYVHNNTYGPKDPLTFFQFCPILSLTVKEQNMTEDRLEFVCGLALLAIAMFAMTPAFWWLVAYLGK